MYADQMRRYPNLMNEGQLLSRKYNHDSGEYEKQRHGDTATMQDKALPSNMKL
jgi:hypothetical protein